MNVSQSTRTTNAVKPNWVLVWMAGVCILAAMALIAYFGYLKFGRHMSYDQTFPWSWTGTLLLCIGTWLNWAASPSLRRNKLFLGASIGLTVVVAGELFMRYVL